MSNGFIAIILLLGVMGGIAKLLDLWLRDEQKSQLILKLREIYTTLNDSDPIAVIQAPMRGVGFLYGMVFGEKILSAKSFKRTSLVSILILIGSLTIAGWVLNKPFAIEESPWKAYEKMTSGLSDHIFDDVISKNKLSAESKEKLAVMVAEVNKPIWKWVYSGSLILLVVFIKVSFDFSSFLVTRKILRELLTTKQPLLIFSALFLDTFLALFIVSFTFLFLAAVTNPLVLIFVILCIIAPISIFNIFSWMLVVWKATFSLAWLLSSHWIKVVALTTMLPTVILLLLCLFVLITFPMRGYIHKFICFTLERLTNYEKGPLIFISACSIALTGVLGAMIELLL